MGAGGDPAPQEPARFDRAIAEIDAANGQDPNLVEHAGERHPRELLHGRLVMEWVRRLDPDAGEAELLAARAHHFRRWTSPRSEHPPGRAGYLRWRTAANRRQAEEVGELLRRIGYDTATADRVGALIRKEGRGTDPAAQAHEDARCLVFVETQLGEVRERLGEEHAGRVLARTLAKMSPRAVDAALALDLPEGSAELLRRAAGRPSAP